MKFYYPELLFGLFLIAIPVIIHLFNFRKFKKVYFSNTRLLKEIKIQTSSRQKIKDRLVLLTRILAVTFLVFAFAKPYIPNKESKQEAGNYVISIYIDNSYSMDAVGQNSTLLEESKKKAVEVVQAFGLNDKFHLISNELAGLQNRLLSRDEVFALLDSVQITPQPNSYQDVVNNQQRFLSQYPDAGKYAFLISDFQKTKDNQHLKLDSAINFRLIKVESNRLANVAVDSVWFLSPMHQPNADEKLVVRLKNYADEAVENVPISLNINGKLKTIGNASVKAGALSTDTLVFSGLQAGWQKGELSIKDYPIIFDNTYYFSFEVKQTLPVTILNSEKKENYFTSLFATDPYFKVQNISESEINYTGLFEQKFIVLNDLTRVPDGLSQQLKLYVENGGNLAVFIPLKADINSYKNFLQHLGADFPLELKSDTVKADKLNMSHSVFNDLFEKRPDNVDLPKSASYFSLSRNTRTTASVLLSEGDLPLLINYKQGKGNLYLSALPLEKNVSNFATHGLFLPILFKMALLNSSENTLAYTLGHQDGLLLNARNIAESEVLQLKGNSKEIIPEVRNTPAGTVIFIADQIKQAGFYELYQKENLIETLAFNDSRAESVREFYNENELKAQFGLEASEIIQNSTASVTNQIKEVNSGISFWKLCLILALIFLAIEILLLRFYNATKI